MLLVHGSGGISARQERWVQELNGIGVATFTLDSIAGRGIANTVTDQSQLTHLPMMVDAFQALGALAKHPRIDPNRIAIMGFSKGAVAAVYSAVDRFRKMYGPPDVSFAAHIGLASRRRWRRDPRGQDGEALRLRPPPCVEKGTHIVYDASAYEATLRAVKELLMVRLAAR